MGGHYAVKLKNELFLQIFVFQIFISMYFLFTTVHPVAFKSKCFYYSTYCLIWYTALFSINLIQTWISQKSWQDTTFLFHISMKCSKISIHLFYNVNLLLFLLLNTALFIFIMIVDFFTLRLCLINYNKNKT